MVGSDQVLAAAAVFFWLHEGCEEAATISRAGRSLFCRCDDCEDLRTYEVSDRKGRDDHRN